MNSDEYESLPTNNILTHMTAGAIAGIMEHCVMYPLDSVKTRMQSLASSGSEGIVETFRRMVKQEGIFRPVRGMSVMVMGAGPSHALYFSTYEFLKSYLIQKTNTSSYHTAIHGASGCIATLIHDGVMTPADVIKQRLQMVNSPYRSVLHCMGSIYKTEGIKAFYRSYTTQLTMNIPFQSIHFMVYEMAKKLTNKEGKYNPPAHMVSGAVAGAVAAAVTTPLDVCKTILNTQQGVAPKGLLEAFKTVYRLRGVAGYFRGMQARIMYTMPATAICWSTYEFFKYLLVSSPEVRIVPSTTVLAEEEKPREPSDTEKSLHKCRELPTMSGAGLYGSISFNTLHHTADTGFQQTSTRSVLDINHT